MLKLLPFMYAAAFVNSKVWGEAQYHSTIEGELFRPLSPSTILLNCCIEKLTILQLIPTTHTR